MNYIENNNLEFSAKILGFISFIIIIFGIVCFFDGILYIFAPEGSVFMMLLGKPV